MELVAPKTGLLKLLHRCQGVADRRSTMPVLANILLRAEAATLYVAATDLYLSVAGSIPADVGQSGTVAVPSRDAYDRVRAMPDGSIRITVGDNYTATIRSEATARRYTLHGLPGSEFPAIPVVSPDAMRLELSVADLVELINRTHFSISTDETRAHLNSALFECVDGKVRMVTTDGHRLSKLDIAREGLNVSTTMLLPLKAISELRKLLDEVAPDRTSGLVMIRQCGPNAFFTFGGVDLSVKLVDAQFPPYDQVIPAMTTRAIRAPRLQLAEALRAVSLAASDRTGGVKVSVSENMLRITSESPESGNAFDEVDVEYSGPELSVGFNARYLLDVLNAIETDEVTVGLSGELDPAVLRPVLERDSGTDYIAVVMPMRV